MGERIIDATVSTRPFRDPNSGSRRITYIRHAGEDIIGFVSQGCELDDGDAVTANIGAVESNVHIFPLGIEPNSTKKHVILDMTSPKCWECPFGGAIKSENTTACSSYSPIVTREVPEWRIIKIARKFATYARLSIGALQYLRYWPL